MFKFRIGDEILVCTGRDKGKKGKIEKVLQRENKVVVTNVNVYKRHRKVAKNRPAGIYEIARPIQVANIALVCPKCNRPTRIGFVIEGQEKKRICKKCQGRLSSQKG